MDAYEQTRTNIHALNGIRTYVVSVQVIKAYASDCKTTGTGEKALISKI